MEKLNELVELANKASKGTWVADSGEGWDAIISQQDMVNSNFIIGEFIGPDSAVNKHFVLAASPENILAIAEAFRALEKRAEAAEEWVKTAERTMDYQAGVITELGVRAEAAEAALERESDIHIDTAAAMREWRVRAEAAEAKLAELEKQKPSCSHHWIRSEGRTASGWLCSKCGDYDGPTPAADMTELVPPKLEEKDGDYQNLRDEKRGYNACIDTIISKIEESK